MNAENIHLTRPTLRGNFGMSASTHWLATASSQAVLERGGNAFDAAVAAGFVLHVVEPHLNGPGGDLVGIFTTGDDSGRPRIMMGQGAAPKGATAEHYKNEGLKRVPGSGALAAAVPTAVDAWLQLLRDYGTWELEDVLAFAINYAENGHAIMPRVSSTIESVKELFTQHWPTSAEQWLVNGEAPEPYSLQTNKPYARVLRRLIELGRDIDDKNESGRKARIEVAREAWRNGFVAEAIAEFNVKPHMHADGNVHAGVMTREDLAGIEATYEDACAVNFRGYTVAKSGAWGQGPTLLIALRILDGFEDDAIDPTTAQGIHTIIEALKLALADRDTHFGDEDVDLDYLLSEEYIATRRSLIGSSASLEYRPGHIPGAKNKRPVLLTDSEWGDHSGNKDRAGAQNGLGVGEPTVGTESQSKVQQDQADEAHDLAYDADVDQNGVTRGDTCHVDVIDQWGNAVAVTPSGGWLQSSPNIPELGFNLGSRLQMTWLEEGSPSTLKPGKRPRTTLSPTLVMKDGQTVAVLGTPGGDQQDQWQLVLILQMIIKGRQAQQAIDSPNFHTTSMAGSFYPRTWTPGGVVVEDRLGHEVIDELERRGHVVTRAGDWALGRLSIVTRDPKSGVLTSGANSRGEQGYAAGR